MNKVVNVNLNGIVFSIDETAYETLRRYLEGLKAHFAGTLGASEIIQDIEARVAELLQSRLSDKYTVIQLSDVEEVIALMGDPRQMDDHEQGEPAYEYARQETQQTVRQLRRDAQHKTLGGVCAGIANYFGIDIMIPRILFLLAFLMFGSGVLVYIIMWIIIPEANPGEISLESQNVKRLFRNPEDKKVGGVCSGIAQYIGIDSVWLRLGFLVALFVFGTGILAYIILWIALPEAKTSAEKLQMKGEAVDVNNIQKVVRENAAKSTVKSTGSVLTEIIRVAFKITSKLIGTILIICAISLLGAVIFLWNYSFADVLNRLDITEYYSYFEYGIGLFSFSVAAMILLVGIKFLFHSRIHIRIAVLILFILSITGLALMLSFGWQYRKSVSDKAVVKETVLKSASPDTLYIAVDQYTLPEEDDEDESVTVTINKDTRSRKIKLGGKVGDWIRVFYNTRLVVKPSVDDSVSLLLTKTARGENPESATENAQAIQFKADLNGNRLVLDEGVKLSDNQPFKYQQVSAKLRVPVGTILKLDPAVRKMLDEDFEEDFDLGNTFKMTSKGLRCIDCEDSEDGEDQDINIEWNVDDDDGEVNIKIKGNNETIEVKDSASQEVSSKKKSSNK